MLAVFFNLLLLPTVSAAAAERVVIAFGDSLVAGYGLASADSLPVVLEQRLRAAGLEVSVRNAGVSGDTTAGGRARLDWSVPDKVDLVILALGGNDMLRGIEPAVARANLDAMLSRLKQRAIPVLLAGMRAPASLGADYVRAFDAIYPELAAVHGVPLYPFLLDGVALKAELNLDDGLHPNPAGIRRIVDGLAPQVRQILSIIG